MIFLVVLLVLTVMLMFYFMKIGSQKAGDPMSAQTASDHQQLDNLFRDVGVLKIPHVTRPVEIVLNDMSGKEVKLSDFRGKIVFLNFWATWCPSCRDEMPSMQKLHNMFQDKDMAMVTINLQESPERVKEYFNELKLSFPALLDEKAEVAARFGITALPTTFILDKSGRVLGKAVGFRNWESKESIALFKELSALEG